MKDKINKAIKSYRKATYTNDVDRTALAALKGWKWILNQTKLHDNYAITVKSLKDRFDKLMEKKK